MYILSLILTIFITLTALTVIIDASTERKQTLAYLGYLLLAAVAIAINLHNYIAAMSH